MNQRFTMFFVLLLIAIGLCMPSPALAAERLTPENLWQLRRIGESQVSPDGSQLIYTVTHYDLAENSGTSDLVLVDLPKTGEPFTASGTAIGFDTPQFATNKQVLLSNIKGLNSIGWLATSAGTRITYIAPGAVEGSEDSVPQVWLLDMGTNEATQWTHIAEGVANLKVSPVGTHLAFTIDVKLDETVNELYDDLPKADARIIDSLLYRHWNQWHDFAYSHVHLASIESDGSLGTPRDLMIGMRADCPLAPFGGSEHFAFSPDGKEIALTIKLVNNPAESTDSSIFVASVAGGSLKNITPGMPGYDTEPSYSPDGRYLAWQSMERAGFEADRNRIMMLDRNTGKTTELTAGLDQTTHNVRWSDGGNQLYFDSEHLGTQQVYRMTVNGEAIEQVSDGWFDFHVVQPLNGNRVLVTQQNTLRPNELAVIDCETRKCWTLTGENDAPFASLELPKVEQRWVRATDGASIHNWVILPPDFDPTKKYPLLVYCQGGPQGQIGQWFSYRWNFHLMAAKGYIVLAVNRRGLPGFGQQWNDQISGDWGGQAMQDILAATDEVCTESYVDAKRVAAVGASFGGYTVYWLMGNHQERFSAMIAHCGVFNLESMYGSTEEIFFTDWDLNGPYWKSADAQAEYNAFSPHRFVGKWRTPLLVIHGEKDFRVPVTQGMEAFTAAQLEGVPSRFLYFPGEGHWVSSPQNSVLWNRVFFDWLDKYLK